MRAVAILITAFVCACPAAAFGDEPSIEIVAERLAGGTVTVRTVAATTVERSDAKADVPEGDAAKPDDAAKPNTTRSDEVTITSGVSLGKGLIVTFHSPLTADALPRFRVTLGGGDQAEAQLRVIDRHSHLLLLEIENRELPGLDVAERLPKVGSTVLTAAAAGIEQPAVSLGILGATDRTLSGIDLPPLLQCDVRTTETSSGAAVVDRAGKLLGVVAATGLPGQHTGWTYAIGFGHVERVVKAKVDGKVIELKRRRPVAGFTLGAGEKEGTVLVERVEKDGPASDADIRAGDMLVETDGIRIRSAYQAIDLILKRQPGEKMSFTVERDGERRMVEVTLGGGPLLVSVLPHRADGGQVTIGPQLRASRGARGEITVRNSTVAENPSDANSRIRRSPGDEGEALRLQLGAYERVIQSMQKEIDELRRETTRLREEVKERK
jgi:S1-C subfamily serine protease